jgi:KaiC/GvpD/RAD55 family RecA-like ATPase
MVIERIKTGIGGFDELVQGGFPRNYTILISGSPGTGKTIFALQFLYHGARDGEKCIYVSFDQNTEDLILQGEMFGWELRPLMQNGTLRLISMDIKDVKIDDLLNEIRNGGYKRVVLDSLSAILLHPIAWKDMDVPYIFTGKLDELIPDPQNLMVASRVLLNKILAEIKKLDCTSILISELTEGSKGLSRDTISEFLADGVITLHYLIMGATPGRNLIIRKMRATRHSEMIHPMEFVDGVGIKVLLP